MRPARRAAIFSSTLSTQTTSLPRSANTAPVTSPTYPVPTTQMFMAGHDNRPRTDGRQGRMNGGRREGAVPPSCGERVVVLRIAVRCQAVNLFARVTHGIAQGVEALAGDRDGVALVARFPHPLPTRTPDG